MKKTKTSKGAAFSESLRRDPKYSQLGDYDHDHEAEQEWTKGKDHEGTHMHHRIRKDGDRRKRNKGRS